jgi:DNA-binding response OmpR family regulator
MNLRRKIEPTQTSWRYIATVPGLGYRFEAPRGDGAHAEGSHAA